MDRDATTRVEGRLPVLDGIRGLALLGVVTMHMLGASGVLLANAGTDTAVALWAVFGNNLDAFIFISGFVLFLPIALRGGRVDAVDFWVRRGARLLPLFWLVLALILLALLIKPPPGYSAPSLVEVGVHLVGMQLPAALVDPTVRIGFAIDGPLWIISVVVAFYVLLPLVARRYLAHPIVGLLLVAGLTAGWKELVARRPEAFDPVSSGTVEQIQRLAVDQFPGWAFTFALGMTGAWAFIWAKERWEPERLQRFAVIALPFVAVGYAVGSLMFGRMALTSVGNFSAAGRGRPWWMLFTTFFRGAALWILAVGPRWMQWPFENAIARRIAELSYGVFLIHWPIGVYLFEFTSLPTGGTLADFSLWMVAVLVPSFVLAAVFKRWFEDPIQERVRAWLRARRESRAGRTSDQPVAAGRAA